jgi:hypothetical protein
VISWTTERVAEAFSRHEESPADSENAAKNNNPERGSNAIGAISARVAASKKGPTSCLAGLESLGEDA